MGVLDDLSPTQRAALSSATSAPRRTTGSDVRDPSPHKTGTTGATSSSSGNVRADKRDTSTPTRTNTAAMVSGSSDTGTPNRSGSPDDRDKAPDPFASSKNRNRSGSPDDRDSGRGKSTTDPVDPDTKLSYGMMLDFLETPERNQPSPSSRVDRPGDEFVSFDQFRRDVRNGSLGLPRAAGYGLDYNPDAGPIAFDPMAQDTAAMNESLKAPPPMDVLQSVHDFLQAPYQRRVDENGGVAPFEGPIDKEGIYKFLQQPYLDRIAREAAAKAPKTPSGWEDPWSQLNPDYRLPSEPLPNDARPAPYIPDQTVQANDRLPSGEYLPSQEPSPAQAYVPLPRVDPRGYVPAAAAIDSNYGDPGLVTGTPEAPAAEPSVWDGVVDNTGKLLGHTALGGVVSTLFPDLWNGAGDLMKGLGINGAPAGPMRDYPGWDADRGTWAGNDPEKKRKKKPPVTPPPETPPATFPDLNHNGIDDRTEGYNGPDTHVVFDLPPTRSARFPNMPPYNPGRSDEWSYFTNNHLSEGGVVGYAEGGALDGSDPRVKLIGDTEDILGKIKDGTRPDEADTAKLKAFVAQFGDGALKSLHDNVQGGMTMRGGRLIKGPGGPKDDAVPAVIIDKGTAVSPAKLSNGEFVFPVEAVEGIGEGDAALGAERLQQLAERLSAGKKVA